jgi:hypothetical protein
MLKTIIAMVGVTKTLQTTAAPAAPARKPASAPAAQASAQATNAQAKARGTRRLKARPASAASTVRPQKNAAVYIPRCYDCPM